LKCIGGPNTLQNVTRLHRIYKIKKKKKNNKIKNKSI
jgi:hypothetical protein